MKSTTVLKFIVPLLILHLFGFGQTTTFLSNVDNQNTDSDIGRSVIEKNSTCNMFVVNPYSAGINTSQSVLKLINAVRSEYGASRHETMYKILVNKQESFVAHKIIKE